MNEEKKEKRKVSYLCIGNLLGIILGLTLGRMLFNNPGAGLCFFAGLGMIIGSVIDSKEKKKRSEKVQDSPNIEENL